jgi:transposase
VRTLQAALNSLAVVAPRWLQSWVPDAWHARYDELVDNYDFPKQVAERRALAEAVGVDGLQLLERCSAADAPGYLREVEAVAILRQVWLQQYYVQDTRSGKQLRWRAADEVPPHAKLICSPYEVEARYSTKRETHWLGYKVHLTETCDPEKPRLITHVVTTSSTTHDDSVLPEIHTALAAQECLPGEHLVDAGYITATTLVDSARDYQVRLTGPAPPDSAWQAHVAGGYTLADFAIDWEAQVVTCPQGQLSTCWSESVAPDRQPPLIHVRFSRAACHACGERARCTRARKDGRTLTFLSRTYHSALQQRRQDQRTPQFWERLKPRAGIEGTLSQGVRAFGLRRTRYRGLAKTHLQHVLTAVGMNLMRMVSWATGHPPHSTRTTRFARLGATCAPVAV